MKRIFIAWTAYHRRSELMAEHLGASLHHIVFGQSGRLWQAPLRYLVQGWQTWKLLRRERPELVVVQNPPIFSALLVYLFGRLYGAEYVMDSHTSAFVSRRWRRFSALHRWLSRRARAIVVHNQDQAKIVQGWGCPYSILSFTPGEYPLGASYPLQGRFSVAAICMGSEDEPLDIIAGAARHLPDVQFYVTGKITPSFERLASSMPPNCTFTGYLPYEEYIGLLRGVDVIMDLTTRPNGLLMGGFEAVSLGKPLITSDWPILRAYFHLGTIHVPNTPEGIRDGLLRARSELTCLQSGMSRLHDVLQREWDASFAELEGLLQREKDPTP